MYQLLFIMFIILNVTAIPNRNIAAHRLDILPLAKIHDDTFYESNLSDIIAQPYAVTLRLVMVTCPLSHITGTDEDPVTAGFQHMAVFAANTKGDLLVSGYEAALPCPPHCAGGKYGMTLAEFLASH